MVIYLRHDVHGCKVACTEAEATYDEGLGWERFDPETPESVPDFLAPTNELKRGRGRPAKG
jgi:hypothetical protein